MTKLDDETNGMPPALKKLLIVAIGVLPVSYISGYFAGSIAGTIERGEVGLHNVLNIAGSAALIAGILFVGWKLWPPQSEEVVAQSTRKSNRLLTFAAILGVALGVFLILAEGGSPATLFSNAPLNGLIAAVGIAVWLLIVPPMTWIWWRTVDEHEASAYTDGALVAGHVYIILAPSWWFASRARWVPAQDPMIVFAIVATVWTVIWLYRRFF